jgi:hypothetical protein
MTLGIVVGMIDGNADGKYLQQSTSTWRLLNTLTQPSINKPAFAITLALRVQFDLPKHSDPTTAKALLDTQLPAWKLPQLPNVVPKFAYTIESI